MRSVNRRIFGKEEEGDRRSSGAKEYTVDMDLDRVSALGRKCEDERV